MIQDSWAERPIYFARSAVGYPRALGLENNVLTQGLAAKLFIPPTNAATTRDTVFVQGDGWFDVARTLALWNDVFQGHRAAASEGLWIDRPSASMPALYVFEGTELAQALRATGRAAAASTVLATTKQVAHATRLDGLIHGADELERVPVAGDTAGVTLRANSARQPRVQSTEPAGRRPRRSRSGASQTVR
jgi:hypothetical protein